MPAIPLSVRYVMRRHPWSETACLRAGSQWSRKGGSCGVCKHYYVYNNRNRNWLKDLSQNTSPEIWHNQRRLSSLPSPKIRASNQILVHQPRPICRKRLCHFPTCITTRLAKSRKEDRRHTERVPRLASPNHEPTEMQFIA